MAILKPSALVQAISGRVGGATFAQTKNGTVLKVNPQKKKPTTARALNQSNRYWFTLKNWRNLSPELREAWRINARNNTFTNRLGTPINLTGFQLYMKIFMQGDGLAFPPNPPLLFSGKTPPPTGVTFSAVSGGAKQITFSTVTAPNPPWAIVSAARPLTAAPKTTFRRWRTLGVITSVTSPITVTAAFDAAWGNPQTGETVAIRLRLWDFDNARIPSADATAITTVS